MRILTLTNRISCATIRHESALQWLWARVCYPMSENQSPQSTKTEVVTKTLAQGSLIGVQGGCVSVMLIIAALVVGLLLDRALGTKYMFTVGLLLLSIPISLGAMVYTVLRSARSLQSQPTPQSTKKEDSLEKTD